MDNPPPLSPPRIGVLALQGSFGLHRRSLESLGVEVVEVRRREDLKNIQGLILPGGESTTHHLILNSTGLWEAIKDSVTAGMPVWGTCAGAILMGYGDEPPQPRWQFIEVEIIRNAYGRQVDSFIAPLTIPDWTDPLFGVFIRAPHFRPLSSQVEVLATWGEEPVMLRQDNRLITAFHPELTDDLRLHRWFISQICGYNFS